MAGQIIWSREAQSERVEILRYWAEKNLSPVFSRKLQKAIVEKTSSLLSFPFMGKKTSVPSIRIILVTDYKLFYQIVGEDIIILRMWDSRQDPDKQPFP